MARFLIGQVVVVASTPLSKATAQSVRSSCSISAIARAGPIGPGEPAIFYYGPSQLQTSFGGGFRCVGGGPGQVVRIFPFVTPDAMDFVNATLNNALPVHAQVIAGATLNFQAWFRDPAGMMAGYNLSNGTSVTFVP